MKVDEPVADDREEYGDEEEVGDADDEVGNEKGSRAVKAVGAFFGEGGEILKEGGDVGDRHEGHKGAAEEECVDEGLDVRLGGGEAEPDGLQRDIS